MWSSHFIFSYCSLYLECASPNIPIWKTVSVIQVCIYVCVFDIVPYSVSSGRTYLFHIHLVLTTFSTMVLGTLYMVFIYTPFHQTNPQGLSERFYVLLPL